MTLNTETFCPWSGQIKINDYITRSQTPHGPNIILISSNAGPDSYSGALWSNKTYRKCMSVSFGPLRYKNKNKTNKKRNPLGVCCITHTHTHTHTHSVTVLLTKVILICHSRCKGSPSATMLWLP